MTSPNASWHQETCLPENNEGIQARQHMKSGTYLVLKAHLISDPILSAPHYNGTLFMLTTDGCKDAFTGVLAQQITMMLPGGKKVT